jgi:8-oxo-dGTP diphosphatase
MEKKQRFHFCPKCGGRLGWQRRHDRERLACGACGYMMYENPVVGVAAIVMEEGRLLLGRRASWSTYPGKWCIPCGYVEYDEDVYDAIKREFREETGLTIEPAGVYTVLSNWHNPEAHTVGIWFSATVTGGQLRAGDDLDEVGYFPLDGVPPLAFPTDAVVIEMLQSRRD